MIPHITRVSSKAQLYQVNLTKKSGKPFSFQKYHDISQLGRFFALRLNNKVTRLYTVVAFLVPESIRFIEKVLNLKNVCS